MIWVTPGRWWGRFAAELASIAVALWACTVSLWLIPLAMLVIGSRLQALAIIGHMATHGYCGAQSKLLCRLAFLPVGLSPEKYKQFHFAHHRHLGTPDDPELVYVYKFRKKWERPRLRDSIADLLGLNIYESIMILKPIVDARSVALMVGFIGLVALVIGWPAFVLLASYSTTLLCVFRLRYRAEHDHLNKPGETFQKRPSLLARWLYLPYDHWRHREHHAGVRGV